MIYINGHEANKKDWKALKKNTKARKTKAKGYIKNGKVEIITSC